jgi:signal peptidase I
MNAKRARPISGYVAFALIALLWALFLRPQWLGGSTAFITVRGDSMLPTYQNGDFLMVAAQATYGPGDIVAYKVPQAEVGAGHVVVHRIKDAQDGAFVIQGDNNPEPDPWSLSTSNMVGRVVVRIPGLGSVIEMALSPTIAATIAASVMVMFLVARATKPRSQPEKIVVRGHAPRRVAAASSDS